MKLRTLQLLLLLLLQWHMPQSQQAQGTVPVFEQTVGQSQYSLVGRNPSQEGTTTIPTVLVPITLSFDAKNIAGRHIVLDAQPDLPSILRSPVFSKFSFDSGEVTQYADAMLRATFPAKKDWHTMLSRPEVKPMRITVPVGYGYVLTSKKSGRSFGVVDVEFLQRDLFKQIPKQNGALVIAVAENTTYYSDGDATECCSWGTHGALSRPIPRVCQPE